MYIKKRGKKKLGPAPEDGAKASPLGDDDGNGDSLRLGDYQLMESIGRGGYGLVYRGLNIVTGLTVAIKKISLYGIPGEELESITMEIKLLENLDHPNIVKYLDSQRTESHLYIILEYIENGALSSLLNKFGGSIPETLVCHYIAQVLQGLNYLHTQGVIHRDIKGANILSTKDGTVKLADFGVATKLNESRKSDSVVGTPYWMAPEIIEMTGAQSSACDIWSVGCTAIELLTGKPPYFDLQQMPALFRIVQDEHPPLPDSISPALKDFLLQCFQKDPNRRIDAKSLLKHPWLKLAMKESKAVEVSKSHREEKSINSRKEIAIISKPSMTATLQQTVPVMSKNKLSSNNHLDIGDDEDWDAELNLELADRSPKPRLLALKDYDDDSKDPFEDFSDDDDTVPVVSSKESHSTTVPRASAKTNATSAVNSNQSLPLQSSHAKVSDFSAFVETDDDNILFDDDEFDQFDDIDLQPKLRDADTAASTLTTTNPNALAAASNDNIDDLDFDEFDDFDTVNQSANDELIALHKQLARLIQGLSLYESEDTIIDNLNKLMDNYRANPTITINYLSLHAVIAVVELLTSNKLNIIYLTLRFINSLIKNNQQFQQSLALVGLIPTIIKLALSNSSNKNILYESNLFILEFCSHSDYTRKLFIACDGLPLLIHFLCYENYDNNSIIVTNTVDCIKSILEIQSQPRNDFLRLFCKHSLLGHLCKNFIQMINDSARGSSRSSVREYVSKVCSILFLFSQGDHIVKKSMAQLVIVQALLQSLALLNAGTGGSDSKSEVLLLLKCLCNLSMDSTILDDLEGAGIIPKLMPYLNKSQSIEVQNQTLLIMFYLTQFKLTRQELAVRANILPSLIRFISLNSPLKQFAYPIFYNLLKTSIGRVEGKKYQCLELLILSLKDYYWCIASIDILALWLNDEPSKIGFLLLENTVYFQSLLNLFCDFASNAIQYEKFLPLFKKLLSGNLRLNQAFGTNKKFLLAIKTNLIHYHRNNNIRINLLNILGLVIVSYRRNDKPNLLVQDHELLSVLQSLADDTESVLVATLARKTLERLHVTATTTTGH